MVSVGCVFLFFGVLGFFGSTFGSSGLAWIFTRFSVADGGRGEKSVSPLSLDIIIAARNEEKQILQTLSSIAEESAKFLGGHSARVRILVGADHCTDATEALALQWFATNRIDGGVITSPSSPGKWNILEHLVSKSDAEWIALVDVGATWEPGLLTEALPHLQSQAVSGVAPSYRPAAAGVLERFTWGLERMIKGLESRAGGPVSVHGSTVLYRRARLIEAYAALKRAAPLRHWLNDDVVLPMMLRILSPRLRIAYLGRKNGLTWVSDYGVSTHPNSESGRRRRILIGNLQWMKTLYGKAIRSDVPVGLIASRRVLRAFWAYWASCGFIGAALLGVGFFHLSFGITLPIFVGLVWLSRDRLPAAFWVGLKLPLYWFTAGNENSEKLWN